MNLFRNVTNNLLRPSRILVNAESHLCRGQIVEGTCEIQKRNHSLNTSELKQEKSYVSNMMYRGYKTLCSFKKFEQPLQTALARNQTVQLLKPSQIWSTQVSGYKVKRRLRKRCPHCYFERRKGRWYIECKVKPRHKQMEQMPKYKLYSDD